MSIVLGNLNVDETISGSAVSIRTKVIASTITSGNLSTDFENGDILDGISLNTGDRILIKNQTNPIENGIYIVQNTGTPIRSDYYQEGLNVSSTLIIIDEGTVNADTLWLCTNNIGSDVVGTDGLNFIQIGSGNIIGPVSSTDNAIVRWDGTNGTNIQNSNIIVGDNGNLVISGTSGYIELPDITAPSNPGVNLGRLYKKTGNDGIFWLPDSSGSEVDLTNNDINITQITATANTTTTSTTYILLNAMTSTPPSGDYLVSFSASCSTNAGSAEYFYAIFVDGTIVQHSERQIYDGNFNFVLLNLTMHTQAVVSVNGSQTIEIRQRRTTGGTITVFERSLQLIKLN